MVGAGYPARATVKREKKALPPLEIEPEGGREANGLGPPMRAIRQVADEVPHTAQEGARRAHRTGDVRELPHERVESVRGNEGGAGEVGAKSVEQCAGRGELVVRHGDLHENRVQVESEEAADLGGRDGLLVVDLQPKRRELGSHAIEPLLACRLRVGDEQKVVEVDDDVETE